MALIRSLLWFALFVASTFCFVVLFENGISNFGENAQKEFESVKTMVGFGAKKAAAPGK
ncbi:MAG: hypothetical protein ABIP20_20330 [Chthoniobacteraceae bacterium]